MWKIAGNSVFVLLVVLLLVPKGRMWIHQGLMKLGLFKPNLEQPKEAEGTAQADRQSALTGEDIVFSDDGGQLVRVADLRGKVAFINFWATWCGPCRAEMPSIEVLKNKFEGNDGIRFLMVEVEHDQAKAHAFLRNNNLDLPIYYPESQLPGDWLSGAIPVTVILDKEGKMAVRHEGMADYSRQEVYDFLTGLIEK